MSRGPQRSVKLNSKFQFITALELNELNNKKKCDGECNAYKNIKSLTVIRVNGNQQNKLANHAK